MNLASLVRGSAELRKRLRQGYGKSKSQARQRLRAHRVRLAVGSAVTLGVFLYETHEARAERVSRCPAVLKM